MNMFLHFWYPKYKDTPGVSNLGTGTSKVHLRHLNSKYDSLSDVGEIRVYQRADFQSGSRVLKKVF